MCELSLVDHTYPPASVRRPCGYRRAKRVADLHNSELDLNIDRMVDKPTGRQYGPNDRLFNRCRLLVNIYILISYQDLVTHSVF